MQAANPTLVQLLLALPRGDLQAFVNMKVGACAGMSDWVRCGRDRQLDAGGLVAVAVEGMMYRMWT